MSRPEQASLAEAERTRGELAELGVRRQELVLNGLFTAEDRNDPIACALEARGRNALSAMPSELAKLPRTELRLLPFGLVGAPALRALFGGRREPETGALDTQEPTSSSPALSSLLPELERAGHGVIMTMGKGGVGKTSVAVSVALALAARGHQLHLTTTDPAAHVREALGTPPANLRVSRIDPEVETRAYVAEAMRTAGATLDDAGRALLEEDLRSPCTEEIAVFRAFARVVDEGERGFVVIDTAPTGHTLLLLDAAETFHREVSRTTGHAPEDVRRLLPRLRDPSFTRILLVTLPEATPVHEAAALQRDLARAEITPFAWVLNQCLTPLSVSDPVLRQRRANEARYLREVSQLSARVALIP